MQAVRSTDLLGYLEANKGVFDSSEHDSFVQSLINHLPFEGLKCYPNVSFRYGFQGIFSGEIDLVAYSRRRFFITEARTLSSNSRARKIIEQKTGIVNLLNASDFLQGTFGTTPSAFYLALKGKDGTLEIFEPLKT